MKDIKNKTISIKTRVTEKQAATTLSFKKPIFFKYYNLAASGVFGILLAVYMGSMIGISVFAIQEKSYSVKTEALRSQEASTRSSEGKETALALSNLNLNKDHMSHIYVSSETMNSMSQR